MCSLNILYFLPVYQVLLCSVLIQSLWSFDPFENTVLVTRKSKYSYFMWKIFLLHVNTHR